MSSYAAADQSDRWKAIVAAIAVNAVLGVMIVTGLNVRFVGQAVERLVTINVREPPPPPPVKPPPPAPKPQQMKKPAGAPAPKAEPTPVVAPQPKLPVQSPIPAAKIAGTGSASSSGAGTSGSGTGAGGAGTGPGGGGGIVAPPHLIAGAPTRADYHRLGAWVSRPTRALIRLTIMPNGRVGDCVLVGSSGYSNLDERLCPTLAPPMLWSPARDGSGRAITSWLVYVVTLDRR